MKYTFILSFFCIYLSNNLYSQAPAIEWQKTYGGLQSDLHNNLHQTSDGGYIHIGSSSSNNGDVTGNHGSGDIWVLKTNAIGDIMWQKCFGGSYLDIGTSIQQTSDGGYILAGITASHDGDVSVNYGYKDSWVIKLDASGNIQWQKTYGGPNDDSASSIRQTTDGGYIVAGYKSMAPPTLVGGNKDFWIIKLDALGNIEWEQTYGDPSGWEEAHSIEQTTDGGYIVAGYSSSPYGYVIGNHGANDYWVIKITATGILQWQQSLGSSTNDVAQSVKQTTDGGYIVSGYSILQGDGGSPDYDFWIVKLNSTGSTLWQNFFGGSMDDRPVGLDSTPDGGCIVAGFFYSYDPITGFPQSDFGVIKLNALGNVEWQNSYGGTYNQGASSIQRTSDGGYIIGGFTQTANVTSDFLVIKLAGNQLGTHENTIKSNISIYPNPAKDFVTIDHLPAGATISIHDMSGRKIFNKKYSEAKVSINTSAFSSGAYIVQVDDQEKTILSEKLSIKK